MSTLEGWVERAQYDIDTARAMLNSGRYLYVVFCCQQAVEKALKAVIVKNTGDMPPRIHSLMRLSEIAALDLSEEQTQLFRELSNYYIQTRYPEEMLSLAAGFTREEAHQMLHKTEIIMTWLFSTL